MFEMKLQSATFVVSSEKKEILKALVKHGVAACFIEAFVFIGKYDYRNIITPTTTKRTVGNSLRYKNCAPLNEGCRMGYAHTMLLNGGVVLATCDPRQPKLYIRIPQIMHSVSAISVYFLQGVGGKLVFADHLPARFLKLHKLILTHD